MAWKIYLLRQNVLVTLPLRTPLGGTGKDVQLELDRRGEDAGELEGLPPIILAGGLTPENVGGRRCRLMRPYAVDVSSGVEVAGRPGIKDPIKMRDFIQAARGA